LSGGAALPQHIVQTDFVPQRNDHYVLNPAARRAGSCPRVLNPEDHAAVVDFFRTYPGYFPTPLRSLSLRAKKMGVRELLVKDESSRFGLNSFKILGVSYAIHRLFENGILRPNSIVACATDGNHGRALAHVARQNQLRSRIYIHKGTCPARVKAIESEGAQVILVTGNYDDCVIFAAQDATKNGWIIVSDTAWPGYEIVPRYIMAGYTMLIAEAADQWVEPPDLVIVQAGVGGLACAVISALAERFQSKRPFIVSCEPENAACVLESVRAGKPVVVGGALQTIMAGLSCGTVSSVVWPVLQSGLDACAAITDVECAEAVRSLAQPESGDPSILAGESGACGLAALNAFLRNDEFRPVRDGLRLGPQTRVLLINTEGTCDPQM
jgi:diaminopropionate ammonia-lyase